MIVEVLELAIAVAGDIRFSICLCRQHIHLWSENNDFDFFGFVTTPFWTRLKIPSGCDGYTFDVNVRDHGWLGVSHCPKLFS
jgi:hypothetical protein